MADFICTVLWPDTLEPICKIKVKAANKSSAHKQVVKLLKTFYINVEYATKKEDTNA